MSTAQQQLHDTFTTTCFNMPGFQIGVQPPKKAQAGAYLYPPVIAKHSVRRPEGDVDYFATAVLLDRRGAVVDGYLEGTKAASRYEVASSKSSTASFMFPFADLSIAHAGTFTICIDVYQFVPGDYAGAALVAQLGTRAISVVAGEAATESPCKFLCEAAPAITARPRANMTTTASDERSLMRKARDAGLPLPA